MNATLLSKDLKNKLLVIIKDDKLNGRKRQCQFLLDAFIGTPSLEYLNDVKKIVDRIIKEDNISLENLSLK
tara:strand:+ start:451 stop:663 length:213 start_codon:yes stop_codon:yes gene_type:complete